jgi:hypothetical protein
VASAPRTVHGMSPACLYVLLPVLACHVGKHVGADSGGSIWAAAVPGWITASATVGLLIGAIFTAVYAARAFGKQSLQLADQRAVNDKQTDVLELQAKELRESLDQRAREAAEQRRAQASQVFIWTEPGITPGISQAERAGNPIFRASNHSFETVEVHIRNTSRQPIYDLAISWYRGTATWESPHRLPVLMPDDQEDCNRTLPADPPPTVDRSLFGAVARFRDAAGVHWLIRPGGQLDEEPVQ